MDAARQEVVFQDGIPQEVVALLGTISSETLFGGHLVGSLMDGLDDSWCQRLRHVADTQRDDFLFRMHGLEGVNLFGDISEQVVVRQLQEVIVY